jgi:hypothetical protein
VKRALLLSLFVAAAAFVACKSGEGERCQVDDDCDPGLSCNMAENTCQSGGGVPADASFPVDALLPDGPVDAMPDAPDAS